MVNVGGLPVDDTTNTKMKEIHAYMSKLNVDVIGLSECNISWKNLPVQQCLQEQTRGWWESLQINSAYYESFGGRAKSQAGGVSLWSINKGAHRVMEGGKDPSGLGRWAWTRYRGRQGINLRVVVAYRPVLNTTGPLSVWNQQKAFFESADEDRCPRTMFSEDLCKAVKEWMEAGDQIVVGMDANEDVRRCSLSQSLRAMGLEEVIIKQHGQNGPATYARGSCPIDGLFVSRTLQGCRCGYDAMVWDHRLLWIDIPVAIAFGNFIPPAVAIKSRRLKLNDPRIVSRYQELYRGFLKENLLVEAAQELDKVAFYPSSWLMKRRYDQIDEMRTKGMMFADKNCRRVCMGAKQWTPDYQRLRENVALWRLVVKKLSGGSVHSRFLTRLMKSCGRMDALSVSLEEAMENRASAHRLEKAAASKSITNRKTWLQSLCDAKAEAGNVSAEKVLANFIRVEDQRRNARIIRAANGKLRSGGVTQVIAKDLTGTPRELSIREDIEKALCEENARRFNQACSCNQEIVSYCTVGIFFVPNLVGEGSQETVPTCPLVTVEIGIPTELSSLEKFDPVSPMIRRATVSRGGNAVVACVCCTQ